MKKLTLVTLISGALSASAFAGGDMNKDKISSSFQELDGNSNGHISQQEAREDGSSGLKHHFSQLDSDSNDKVSQDEFNTFLAQNPQHFHEDVAQNDRYNTERSQSASTSAMNSQAGQIDNQQRGQSSAFGNDSGQTARAEIQGDRSTGFDSQDNDVARSDRQATTQGTYQTNSNRSGSTERSWDTSQQAEENRNTVAQNRSSQNSQSGNSTEDQWGSSSGQEAGYDDNIVVRSKFETVDTDGDGRISKTEATQNGVEGSFDDIDEDGDELISRVEYSEYNQGEDDYDDE